MAIYHCSIRMIGRGIQSNGAKGNPVKALGYIAGTEITDKATGEVFGFKDKSVQDVQILLPENAPQWARDIQKLVADDREAGIQLLSDIANAAEKREDAQLYREVEFSLFRELTYDQNKAAAEEFVKDQFCREGMLAIQAFHVEMDEETGELNPHCHNLLLTRELVEEGLSKYKNRDWNSKVLHAEWREQWAQVGTAHLKQNGFDITLDHRSYKDQGLDIEPQPKLGKSVTEQEKRAILKELADKNASKTSSKSAEFAGSDTEDNAENLDKKRSGVRSFITNFAKTERAEEFREVQLRNLYRIVRRPEVVLDIVTRNQATFMWVDVQKVLHRYVDDPTLFQRLDSRLKASSELVMLCPEGVRDDGGRIEDKAIYTTQSLLHSEKTLVKTAEALSESQTHGISQESVQVALRETNAAMGEGQSLSNDQVQAIEHLTSAGQLKCIVGYAGSGKSTALKACKEAWEAEGYRVYGFAPTGKAANGLEDIGINSTTLHRFLLDFESGRNQYSEKSILVLDEGGMVDLERFQKFLNAVQKIGAKAVVVGDGRQLQPVEAGPAFRLVTERSGAVKLETIVRQKEAWQREATVKFGKGDAKSALQAYVDKGHVHIVEETLPAGNTPQDVIQRYEMATRTAGLIYRDISREISEKTQGQGFRSSDLYTHEDYKRYNELKTIQKDAAREILNNASTYRPYLEERRLDPTEMARLFVNKDQSREDQYKEAHYILTQCQLTHLMGAEKPMGQGVDVRSAAKAALLKDWQSHLKTSPEKSILILANTNRDVKDLNTAARSYLKEVGQIGKQEFTYTITKEIEDDFGRKGRIQEERSFSQGDRIIFTGKNKGMGVSKGVMGTITNLSANSITVSLDRPGKNQDINFAPSLFSHFDQGWAVTIYKAQGATVDKAFVLASHEMTQNLSYVSLTRHREDVQVYGSTLDFWRPEKLPEILSKSGEKLSAGDYLDANALTSLMKEEDKFLGKLFNRLSDELNAMGAVSKKAFEKVSDYFFGRSPDPERDIILKPETLRESQRAQDVLNAKSQEKTQSQAIKSDKISPALQAVYEDWKKPEFAWAKNVIHAFNKGIQTEGEDKAIAYWNERKVELSKDYQEMQRDIKYMLNSPRLGHLTDKEKIKAQELGQMNPKGVLDHLYKLQLDQLSKQSEKLAPAQMQNSQSTILKVEKPETLYEEFKKIRTSLPKGQMVHSKEDRDRMYALSFKLSQNHGFMEKLKTDDIAMARLIQSQAAAHQRELRSLDKARGGIER